jgi:hypothetical protein
MSQVTATVEFNQEKGIVKFAMDLQGNTELDHELLAAAIGNGRKVIILPAHNGEELFAEFTIEDEDIWPEAMHNLENRHRARDGKPSLEQEYAEAKARDDAAKNAVKLAADAAKKAEADAQAKQDADDARLAKVVSAAVSATVNAPKTS